MGPKDIEEGREVITRRQEVVADQDLQDLREAVRDKVIRGRTKEGVDGDFLKTQMLSKLMRIHLTPGKMIEFIIK